MAKKRIVMALSHRALGTNLPERKGTVTKTTGVIADFIQEGWQAALVHSNAPQVGMIYTTINEFDRQHRGYISAPMPACSAMSQGYIGYDLQSSIRTELVKHRIYKPVATILTQMMVDPYDEAFYTSVKLVGRYMTTEKAREEEEKGNYVGEIPGEGFRHVVASPKPVAVVGIDVIKAVLDAGQIVITYGGGGIPMMEQGYSSKGAGAVIERDRAAGLLTKEIDADVLIILTSADNVTLNYGRADEKPITAISLEDIKTHTEEGQSEFASMLPKIETPIDFITHGNGRCAIITSMEQTKTGLSKRAGTTIR